MTELRVAYVLGTTAGGTGRHVAMLAYGCARAGSSVRVFGPEQTRSLFVPGTAGVGFDLVTITDRPRPARDLAAIARLRRLLAGMRPDIVHAHGLRAGALAVLALHPSALVRRRGGRPPALIVTVHNAPPAATSTALVYALLERLVARHADAVLCVSADLAARMRRHGAADVAHAVVPAPWPAQQAALTAGPPSAGPPSAGLPAAGGPPAGLGADGRPVVLAIGRLAPQKGLDTLIAAAAQWRDRVPEPLVVIAGTGPGASDLAGQARDLGVAVRFLGWRDDVPALLSAAEVFVLPSLWEGQPLVVHEALRAGRPIVATDVGGVRDLTGAGSALLIPPGDPAALAAAVRRVLDDPSLAAKLAAAASARAAALPTEAEAVTAALAAYERLAGHIPSRGNLPLPRKEPR